MISCCPISSSVVTEADCHKNYYRIKWTSAYADRCLLSPSDGIQYTQFGVLRIDSLTRLAVCACEGD